MGGQNRPLSGRTWGSILSTIERKVIVMRSMLLLGLAVATGLLMSVQDTLAQNSPTQEGKITQGTLQAMNDDGKPLGDCPLEHTDVEVRIAGQIAQVLVIQKFTNPFQDKIEAIYTFPLGAHAAVSDMTMKIGERLIRGQIKPREEAREIYEHAKAQGHIASLLDEERPNIFTQAVANIEPGKSIEIQITYTEDLKYEDGLYSFVFPMVVGPRYIPGGSGPFVPASVGGVSPGESAPVPDADKITPPVTPEGTRAGHDISVAVHLDAGMEIRTINSKQHEINSEWTSKDHSRALVELAGGSVIPNKDFVLEFSTASSRIEDALLTYANERGGFFTLILQPPDKVQPKEIVSREIVFVIDTSGSQKGFPLEISKSIMRRAIQGLREKDTFNMVTFAGHASVLWSQPRANTEANRSRALAFLETLSGAGGTEMMKAINTALGGTHDPEKIRIVAFFTDGYVGNDMQIIDAVRKYAGTTRVFSFGIGRSVNRYLLDGMALAGRGEVEYALSKEVGEKVATRFYDRINAPVLTDVEIDWGPLADVVEADESYPRLIPDLFSVKPVIVKGRYRIGDGDRTGMITLRGQTANGPFERRVKVTLPKDAPANPMLATLWARAKVEDLMDRDLLGIQQGNPDPAIKEEIVGLGLGYRLLTKYTSFVAVEEKVITEGGQPRRIEVPVEMPEGVSYEGVFGSEMTSRSPKKMGQAAVMAAPRASGQLHIRGGRGASMTYEVDGIMSSEKEALHNLAGDEAVDRTAEAKLTEELRGLVGKLNARGNYTSDKLTVKNGRLEVALYLHRMDEDTLRKLAHLGFVKIREDATKKLLIGTIDVDKLNDIARLKQVRRVTLPDLVG
jgi:Ca-activated chloride channel family protein